ncbi:UNVERIFIED_CONTAM: hypothetical protein HDU68_004827 [Siphonaria sp. JEL0065]|nr:hypothetical protein HDU68_004827 [Siphonaria sp. JEL0065]
MTTTPIAPFTDKPVFTYFDGVRGSRGQVLRLFFADAEIEFVDDVFSRADWNLKKKMLIESGLNPFGAVPIVQIGSVVLTSHIPALKYMSRTIGKYAGSTLEDEYRIDLMADLIVDWRSSFERLNPEHPAFVHCRPDTFHQLAIPRFYHAFEGLLDRGNFVLGAEFSYADILLYQALVDEGALDEKKELLDPYPRLREFVTAFEARPRISAYLEERKRKLGY